MSTAALFAPTSTRRRAIALWLALLLPAMQALAGWHALSHVPMPWSESARIAANAGNGDPSPATLQACELCLTLAGVAHAAPAAAPSALPVLHAAPFMAPVVPAPRAGIATLLAYQGRAPPTSLL